MKIIGPHSIPVGRHEGTQKAWSVEVDGITYETDGGIRGVMPAVVTVSEDGVATVDILRGAR
jgi:hypothetical protein